MKTIYILIILAITAVSRAQSPVLSLYSDSYGEVTGAYYKDLNNDLNNFVGTWVYTIGTTSLTVTLQKKVMQHTTRANYDFYEDILIGEYKYIVNGVIKINTLPILLQNGTPYSHNIVGNSIAGTTDRRIITQFSEPNHEIPGMEQEMIFRRADVGTTQKIKLVFRMTEGYYTVNGQEPQYTSYTIPFGEYVLTKQP